MCNLHYLFELFKRVFKNRMNTDTIDELDIRLISTKYNKPITSDDYIDNQDNQENYNTINYEPDYTFMPINTDIADIGLSMLLNEKDEEKCDNEKDEEKWDNESIYEEHTVDTDPRYAQIANIQKNDIYKRPSKASVSSRHIWKVAGLGNEACLLQIELHLVNWANKYASLTTDNFNITQIQWKCNKTNTSYTSTWNVFVKWILCSCNTTV